MYYIQGIKNKMEIFDIGLESIVKNQMEVLELKNSVTIFQNPTGRFKRNLDRELKREFVDGR